MELPEVLPCGRQRWPKASALMTGRQHPVGPHAPSCHLSTQIPRRGAVLVPGDFLFSSGFHRPVWGTQVPGQGAVDTPCWFTPIRELVGRSPR